MLQTAKLLETSLRLQTAASWLARMARGAQPDEEGAEALIWAGNFLAAVDRESQDYRLEGELTVPATTARPTFYSAIRSTHPRFRSLGLNRTASIRAFLNSLYRVLRSGGSSVHDEPAREAERLALASTLLEAVSQGLLAERIAEDLPDQPAFLR